ncbi:MAG TPA: hypothetical protein VMS64_28615 [Candidatus Methylomirabilis sp.]|nr:hypothetical protein [Candidatus Methylomirabilis sp.]
MTSPAPNIQEPTSEHHLVVGRKSADPAVLLLPAPEGWALPRLQLNEQRAAGASLINRAARDLLGVEVSVLRCLRDDPAGRVRQQVHDLDIHDGQWTPPADGLWITRSTLDTAALARPDQRDILERWFQDRQMDARPSDGRDWIRPGWRDDALAWAGRELIRLGLPRIDEVEQVRVWEFSHVLRLRTAAGDLYLKARPRSGTNELLLTRYLARRFPAWMPVVLAADEERRWLLMRASVGPALMDTSDPSRWEQAAATCARVQIDCIGRSAELVALGCPVRPLDWLEAEIRPLLDDTAALQPGDGEALTDAEVAELRGLRVELQAMCRELAALGVPLSLEHGDLWAANVIVEERDCVLIDWEDACVSHPFLSAFLLLASPEHSEALAEASEARAHIRTAYLAPWREWAAAEGWPVGRLERAFDLAQRLAGAYYAVQFRRFSLPVIETSWEVRAFVPFFLRALLRARRTAGPD